MMGTWRPESNLIDGELDNQTPGKVAGWLRFYRRGQKPLKVTLDLSGDFHEDIRGRIIRLKNPQPSDPIVKLDRDESYMTGFSASQRGVVGHVTAGLPLGPWTEEIAQTLMEVNQAIWDDNGLGVLDRKLRQWKTARLYRERIDRGEPFYAHTPFPLLEWFSDRDGRVVMELDRSQIKVFVRRPVAIKPKTPLELFEDEQRRQKALADHLATAEVKLALEEVGTGSKDSSRP